MEHRWTARGGVVAVALLAALAACTDHPVAPAPSGAIQLAGEELDESLAAFRLADAFTSVSAGLSFTCGTTLDGATWCWGENGSGQLGTGDFAARSRPARVAGVPLALGAATGAAHACVAAGAGDVYCWGDNTSGQLGNGTTTSSAVPVRVQAPAGVRFLAVTAGAVHSCALAAGGGTWCWGDNSLGQLGSGTAASSAVPVRVQAPADFVLVRSGDGAAHTCAITARGAAYCWGDNSTGQLGTGSAGGVSTAPVRVAGGVVFASIAGSGFGHSCGIAAADGRAYCWGDNSTGQLGDGTTTPHALPAPVLGSARYAGLQTGWFHSCGTTGLAGAFCWGDANGGKLGNGTANGISTSPVAVTGSRGFLRIDPGADHSCAVRLDGRGFCWGQGFSGELGNGATANSAVPVQVADPGASSPSVAPSFQRSGEDRPASGVRTWCEAREGRGRIAACA